MNKKVLVAGAGASGIQAVNLLNKNAVETILYDGNKNKDVQEVLSKIEGETEVVLGDLTPEIIDRVSYCVISPGISLEVPFVEELKKKNIEIRSEIELGYTFEKGSVIGITGTNGKTTTTTLVGDIMRAYKGEGKAFTVGNIGIPYAEKVMETTSDSVTTIELSSFQLETITTFHPHVSAILNITPDHLNRHHTMEIYAEVKEQVTMNQTEEDFCILNYEDERLRAFGENLKVKTVWFSGETVLSDGYYLKGDEICFSENGNETVLLNVNDVHLVGRCNYENIMAAIGITVSFGVPMDLVLQVVKDFRAVSHRIEFVEEIRGVKYYDDSKGTNVDAAVQGVKAMTSKTYLIGGGYDKGSDFDDWILSFNGKIRKLLLMGVTKEKIAMCCEKYGFKDYLFVENLEDAVRFCYENAKEGENVLLSPACASWDMFKSYEERGDIFKALVRQLK